MEGLRRFLFSYPPETAHHLAILGLKLYQWLRWKLLGKKWQPGNIAIQVHVSYSLQFRSRVGVAAGFDKNAEVFPALSLFDFGFAEVGTVTPFAQPGNERPRIWRVPPQSLVNAMGFPNVGAQQLRRNILKYRSQLKGFPLFANIGKGIATPLTNAHGDYAVCAKLLDECVDGFVINVSSPNTPALRSLQSEAFLESVLKVFPSQKPVWVKLAPDMQNQELVSLCESIARMPLYTGVVLTNTSSRLAHNVAHHDRGGLSGPPLFERALECVSLARQVLPAPKLVVGVGGISSREDARKMFEAGADLIEVYTAFVYQGPSLIRDIASLG